MAKKADLDPKDIAVDKQEKRPLWTCPPSVLSHLTTGDYSLVGYEAVMAVERKSVADAYGSVSTQTKRDRELRKLGRLSRMPFGAVVITGTTKDVRAYRATLKAKTRGRSKLSAEAVLGSWLTWCDLARRVPLRFATSESEARSFIKTWLRKAKEKVDAGAAWKYNGGVCVCGGGAGVRHARRCRNA